MHLLPKAKKDNLVLQNLDRELLVYDLETNKAYSLNETSAIVFNACDGTKTLAELKAKHKFTDDLIFLALDELQNQDLLHQDETYKSPFTGMSRREVVKKVGLGTMVALPFIIGVAAPAAAAAASCAPLAGACDPADGRQNNCCVDLRCNGICNNCNPFGWDQPVLITDISFWTNFCCSGSATTTPIPGDPVRIELTCL